MKKVMLVVVLVAIVGGGLFIGFRPAETAVNDRAEAAPKTVTAVRGPLRSTVEATGRVVPAQEVEIKCKASGEVMTLPVDVSDTVAKGDLLVQLDPQDETRNVKKSKVNLAVSESRLAQARLALTIGERDLVSERLRAESSLISAQVKANDAAARLKRAEQLMEKKIASVEELDAARATQAQASAGLKDAQARVEDLKSRKVQIQSKQYDITIAEQGVEADRIALADTQRRLADTTVTAPIAGVIATRNVQVGQIIASGVSNVGGGTSVLTLVDLTRMFVLVSVDESDIGRIRVGQPVTITVDAYPDRRLRGSIVRVATKGAVTSNVVTFEVKVEVTSRQKNLLKPEMTANVSIVIVDKTDALILPIAAVQRRGPKSFVTISGSGDKTESRSVTVGDSDAEHIEIITGIKEGETVLLQQGTSGGKWRGGEDRTKQREERMKARILSGGGRH